MWTNRPSLVESTRWAHASGNPGTLRTHGRLTLDTRTARCGAHGLPESGRNGARERHHTHRVSCRGVVSSSWARRSTAKAALQDTGAETRAGTGALDDAPSRPRCIHESLFGTIAYGEPVPSGPRDALPRLSAEGYVRRVCTGAPWHDLEVAASSRRRRCLARARAVCMGAPSMGAPSDESRNGLT